MYFVLRHPSNRDRFASDRSLPAGLHPGLMPPFRLNGLGALPASQYAGYLLASKGAKVKDILAARRAQATQPAQTAQQTLKERLETAAATRAAARQAQPAKPTLRERLETAAATRAAARQAQPAKPTLRERLAERRATRQVRKLQQVPVLETSMVPSSAFEVPIEEAISIPDTSPDAVSVTEDRLTFRERLARRRAEREAAAAADAGQALPPGTPAYANSTSDFASPTSSVTTPDDARVDAAVLPKKTNTWLILGALAAAAGGVYYMANQ